ncbi:hypothetical protein [Fodinicola feengrottensis]|uniref:hypothetical protein n=1 Tax=Fodinicola feengrottensis TaxID=435914 RepID=UPI0024424A1E|nr:hypothetical protein [Fodinicola feengrottensis]
MVMLIMIGVSAGKKIIPTKITLCATVSLVGMIHVHVIRPVCPIAGWALLLAPLMPVRDQ